MSDLAIDARGIAKMYRLGQQERHESLRESLTRALSAPLRAIRRSPADRETAAGRTFWALKGVSFTVRSGEVVGIIGRNGAGKSTLLKVLSRITEPTEGRIVIRGRVASLLEVGTGFHGELTGRENVFLSGAILGMQRDEVRTKYDEIVAFAEVEKFLDTPVKHYSSGMYMRLAFAVAAHLEPEILLVDEVLAVGDAAFQRKCLNKMQEVGRDGRTVFFVSHNMAAITRLCSRAILLEQGELRSDGPATQVVSRYLRTGAGTTALRQWPDQTTAPGNEVVRLCAVRVKSRGEVRDTVDAGDDVTIEIDHVVLTSGRVLAPNLHLFNEDGICLFITIDTTSDWRRTPRVPGLYRSATTIPGHTFKPGTFTVRAVISTLDPALVHADEPDAVAFRVVDPSLDGSRRGEQDSTIRGVLRPRFAWETRVLG